MKREKKFRLGWGLSISWFEPRTSSAILAQSFTSQWVANRKGPYAINAFNVRNTGDLISQKTVDCKADTTRKTFRDTNMTRTDKVDSCFVLLRVRQHCVAMLCNASQTANAHKLQNDPFTKSSSVFWTQSLAPRNTCCHITCFGVQEDQSVSIGVSNSKK